jgi:hypothetical protein
LYTQRRDSRLPGRVGVERRSGGGDGVSRQKGGGEPGLEKLLIYIPQKRLGKRPVERLMKRSQRRDQPENCLVVETIRQYVQREESEN